MTRIFCYTLPERLEKTTRAMSAFARGCGGQVVNDRKVRDGIAVVWGQIWGSAQIMKECTEKGIPFYQIDNGYFAGARGRQEGYFRVTKNALVQNWINHGKPSDRFYKTGIEIKPYKKEPGGLVILCVPGQNFGRYLNLNLEQWTVDTEAQIKRLTDKKVFIRNKVKSPAFVDVLNGSNTHAVVTHSSNAAVEALVEGYAVFCDEMCAAAPVANLDLKNINTPQFKDRHEWAYSLAYSQYTHEEFESGEAWAIIQDNEK
jgi:hypothetical protein